jgi:hypothetical protein
LPFFRSHLVQVRAASLAWWALEIWQAGLKAFEKTLKVQCGTYDISRDPGNGGYAADSGRLVDRNITNQ